MDTSLVLRQWQTMGIPCAYACPLLSFLARHWWLLKLYLNLDYDLVDLKVPAKVCFPRLKVLCIRVPFSNDVTVNYSLVFVDVQFLAKAIIVHDCSSLCPMVYDATLTLRFNMVPIPPLRNMTHLTITGLDYFCGSPCFKYFLAHCNVLETLAIEVLPRVFDIDIEV
ncbi:hypothetical protein SLEP1_g25263 [Rubroshorea leprosula]|uniref:Uncharacterized protein n=1 Tax=Rubroshorea leprosula TaxID=152421 RepID=A0AAV5JSJ8_9ROSI|nr:hypothetical protein SLEP1_g25263 [Rubroshorea leprosula]